MKLYITGRCGGKTTHMIKWLLEDKNRIVLTFNECEAKRIVHHFKLSPDDAKRVISAQQYLLEPIHHQNVGVDNADIVLESILRNRVELISVTEEEE